MKQIFGSTGVLNIRNEFETNVAMFKVNCTLEINRANIKSVMFTSPWRGMCLLNGNE